MYLILHKVHKYNSPMKTQTCLISIIIITYNSSKYIIPCLDSLSAQNDNTEILVYDNASSDNTNTLIKSCHPEVRLIEGIKNIGFAAANNYAADLVQGSILIFLNPDTVVRPNWLSPLVEALESTPNVGAVTPTIVFTQAPDQINAFGNEIHLSGITYCKNFGMPPLAKKIANVGAISGAAFAIKRKLFKKIGGFEASFFMYFEDTDLSLRLRCAGFKCLAVSESKIYHDYTPIFNTQKIYYLERNRYLSILSLMHYSILVIMFPSMLLMEIATWGHCILQGKSAVKAKIRAWLDIWHNRHWIQQRRTFYVNQCTCSNTFMLQAFSPELKIQYLDPQKKTLLKGLELVGWITAKTMLNIAQYIGYKK